MSKIIVIAIILISSILISGCISNSGIHDGTISNVYIHPSDKEYNLVTIEFQDGTTISLEAYQQFQRKLLYIDAKDNTRIEYEDGYITNVSKI